MKRFFRDLFRLIGRYRRGLFLTLVAGLGLWCALLVVSYQLSTDSDFCDSCHYETPYVQSWRESSHTDVDCHSCHRPASFGGKLNRAYGSIVATAQYWTGAHPTIPRAEVDDRNCLQGGCHDTRLSGGTEGWIKGIGFDHSHHVGREARGMRLHCSSCHSQIVQGAHMEVTEETCFLCHFKNLPRGEALSGCRCHSAPGEIVVHGGFEFQHSQYLSLGVGCEDCHIDVTEGNGEVLRTVCWNCHTVRLDTYDDVEFTHRKHVDEHHVNCQACHQPIGHHDVQFVQSIETTCESCHGGSHNPQRDIFMGIGASGVEPYPSVMFKAQVGCDGCHRRHQAPAGDQASGEASQVAKASGEACVACHGLGFDRMLDEWRETVAGYLRAIEPLGDEARAAVRQAGERAPAGARASLTRANQNVEFLREGRGEHNLVYTKLVLLKVQEDFNAALDAVRRGWTSREVLAFREDDLRGDCTQSCHANQRKTKHVEFAGVQLTHYDHVYKHNLQCTLCHDNSEVHGAVRLQRENCLGCHHTQKSRSCTDCHAPQRKMLAGTGGFGLDETAALMAGLACEDCHTDLHGANNRAATLKSCVDCHEQGYDAFVGEWQAETDDQLLAAEKRVAELMSLVVTARARGVGSDGVQRAEHLKNEALAHLEIVGNDRSRGAHNPEFTQLLLESATGRLGEAIDLVAGPSP